MKKNNIYLFLAVAAVVALTAFLGYYLKEYYKADAQPSENSTEDYLVTLRDGGVDTLNYVSIENSASSYNIVNNGDTFVVEGFESLPMDEDKIISFAHSITKVKGTPIPSTEKTFKKYGIDGRATVTAHYIDNSTLTFRVGNPFENKTPCYIDETSQLYFFPSNFLSDRTSSPNDFVKKLITSPPNSADIKSVELAGDCRPLPISLEEYPSNTENKTYKITQPQEAIISKMDLDSALGKVFGIKALNAEVLDPTAEDMLEYEFDKPFSTMNITTTEASFLLKVSKPAIDGTAYIINENTPIIYKIDTTDLAWIDVQYGDLVSTLYVPPNLSDISGFKVSNQNEAYIFDIDHLQSRISVNIAGNYIEPYIFENYFQKITEISPKEFVEKETDLPPQLEMEIAYTEAGKDPDKISFIPDGAVSYVSINGEIRYTTTNACVERILTNTKNIVEEKGLV